MTRRKVTVFTGSRADYGLLGSLLDALERDPTVDDRLVAGGAHLLGTPPTIEEVARERTIQSVVAMQADHSRTRRSDAESIGRGILSMTEVLAPDPPEFLVVLGDRIEVLAAATAAAVLGIRVAHVHGGDIASGICDEGIRHAVTKLAHLHFPATTSSASRIQAMGEPPGVIHMVGSPAVDDLSTFPALDEARWRELGAPRFLVLHHPVGDPDHVEQRRMELILETVAACGPALVMAPNHDPGCTGIRAALDSAPMPALEHLPRAEFIGLLRRIEVLVGNSSAGLIECASVGRPAVDIGTRQSGRERPRTVVHVDPLTGPALDAALLEAESLRSVGPDDRFGSGDAGMRIARILSDVPLETVPLRKRWTDLAPHPGDIHGD